MKWFIKAFKQYADFKGRARRKEYWMFTLFFILIYYGFLILGAVVSPILLTFAGLFCLAALIPSLAVTVRRMHDVGKSGWYCLIPIYSLILACTNSEPGSNKWGANPKEDANEIDEIGQEVE